MHWPTILWREIAIVAVYAMVRGCGGMMGGMGGGRCGCGMPRRRTDEKGKKREEKKSA